MADSVRCNRAFVTILGLLLGSDDDPLGIYRYEFKRGATNAMT